MSDTPDLRTRRVLIEHGLPEGLLPYGLTHADIDEHGAFSVRLPAPVERRRGGYLVRCRTHISGRLAAGRVRELRGVDVKQIVWFPVSAIDAQGSQLLFTVGPVKRALPVDEFPPEP